MCLFFCREYAVVPRVLNEIALFFGNATFSFDVVLALERYISICHPLKLMKHPTLRSSVFYIAVALVGTTLKMPPIYMHFPPVCYDSDFVWLMYPVIVDWVLIAIMLTLTALTIHQFHRLNVKRKKMVKEQDSESTKGREAE